MNEPCSELYGEILERYDSGKWSLQTVANAVGEGKITEAEYTLITGMIYE